MGGVSGIGRATSVLFAEEGANVVVFDARDESRDDGLAAEELVAGLGSGGHFVQGDVGDTEDDDRAFTEAVDRFGGVHVIEQIRAQPEHGVIVSVASNFAFVAPPEASVSTAPPRASSRRSRRGSRSKWAGSGSA